LGFHNSDEFNGYLLGEEKASLDKRMSDVYARKLRHAYYACISYVDAQIGKLLNVLKDTGEFDNTIIVLWGDHGWHLGDHRIWGKHTLYETALGSALIIKAPMMKKGVRNERIVSSIDIYPTLLDLCGVQHPKGLDGHSLTELLSDPEKASWKDVSYSYFNNGVSVRVPQYRLIQFWNGNDSVLELYRYKKDLFERKNMNEDKIVKSILPILRKGFINTAF
jgi:arylsulfatase A-like enzyme